MEVIRVFKVPVVVLTGSSGRYRSSYDDSDIFKGSREVIGVLKSAGIA